MAVKRTVAIKKAYGGLQTLRWPGGQATRGVWPQESAGESSSVDARCREDQESAGEPISVDTRGREGQESAGESISVDARGREAQEFAGEPISVGRGAHEPAGEWSSEKEEHSVGRGEKAEGDDGWSLFGGTGKTVRFWLQQPSLVPSSMTISQSGLSVQILG